MGKNVNSYKLLSVMNHSGIIFSHEFVWERMIMKYLLVVHYTHRRVSSSLIMNLWLLMVHLRVMVIYAEVSRILVMMK